MINTKNTKKSYVFVLIASIFIAMILQVIHLPVVISENRPDFLILIILFFSIHTDFSFKLETAWIVGIMLDLVTGAPLGINAFIMCTQVYLIGTQFTNFAKFNIWQQTSIIGLVNLVVSILGYWIEHIIGQSYYEINFLIPAAATAVFWPIIYLICSILCDTFSISKADEKEKRD